MFRADELLYQPFAAALLACSTKLEETTRLRVGPFLQGDLCHVAFQGRVLYPQCIAAVGVPSPSAHFDSRSAVTNSSTLPAATLNLQHVHGYIIH
jgi:hypothetical protein